jgi:hypothetical protein
MNDATNLSTLLPPRLAMDDYADFICASILEVDPASAARQKEIEKRILTPFRIPEGTLRDIPVTLRPASG